MEGRKKKGRKKGKKKERKEEGTKRKKKERLFAKRNLACTLIRLVVQMYIRNKNSPKNTFVDLVCL